MSSLSQVVILDVGGQLFRTTRGTLTTYDSFFARMLGSDWRESQQQCDTSGETATSPPPKSSQQQQQQQQQAPLTIFIDRDPLCFPVILSHLRSQRVFLPADADRVFLEKLLVEADYYALETLSAHLTEELARRSEEDTTAQGRDTMDAQDVYRTISPTEVQAYFDQGWAFVSTYEANETASCSATGSRVTAVWRNNMCSVCGECMYMCACVVHVCVRFQLSAQVLSPRRPPLPAFPPFSCSALLLSLLLQVST